jgi:hypothetical protein
MLNYDSGQAENEKNWSITQREPGFFAPIVASIAGFLAWLIFILLFAFFWSKGFNPFQDIVVFIVSLCITGLLIGLMWVLWERTKIQRFRRWAYRF